MKITTQSNHTIETVEGEELKRIEKHLKFTQDGFVRVTPGGWLYPGAFQHTADKIYNFKWREDDVVLMGFPKTGTTWMQEILWTMRYNPDLTNLDANLPILTRVPIIDTDMFISPKSFINILPEDSARSGLLKQFKRTCPEGDPTEGIYIQTAEALDDPRTLKTHYPFSLLNPSLLDTVKVVYIARNPRDFIVSFYSMMKLLRAFSYDGTLEDFIDDLLREEMIYSPYHEHIKEAWQRRNHPNLHVIFFENLKADPTEEIKKLDAFLGTNLTQEQIEKVRHYTSFEEMKGRNNFTNTSRPDNPETIKEVENQSGGFFRKGKVGGSKDQLSPDTLAKIDAVTEKYLSEIPFKYSS